MNRASALRFRFYLFPQPAQTGFTDSYRRTDEKRQTVWPTGTK